MRKKLLVRLVVWGAGLWLLWLAFSRVEYHWNWRVVYQYRELFILGFYRTIGVSVGAVCLGLVLGVSAGLARVWPNIWLREAAALYVELFRGTPLLVQIYIFYFCLATAINYDNPLVIGTAALAFFSGAYISEMVRAGVESIDKGQWEAAMAGGLCYRQTMFWVIFPQCVKRIIPPVTGQFVSLIKDSSLLSVISVRELTKASEVVNATTYKTFEAYLPLALFYLLLTYPLSVWTRRLERRINPERSKPPGFVGKC